MEYKVELKPFERKDGVKYKIIEITDVALHTTGKTPTPSVGDRIQRAFEENKPGRIYSHIEKPAPLDGRTLTLELLKMDQNFMRMVREENAKGFKVLIKIRKEGVPLVLGRDTIEFMESKNGKRLLRGLAKENKQE